MTKKHYQQFALMLRQVRKNFPDHLWGCGLVLDDFEARLIAILAEDNPRFDVERFQTAVEEGEG